MYCTNKNHLLDLFFLEGNETNHSEVKEHLENCPECREYFRLLNQSMNLLDLLEEEDPSGSIFSKILDEVAISRPKTVQYKSSIPVIPILQIAFGEIFIFSLIYFLKIQLTIIPFLKNIQDHWIFQAVGSMGISVLLVLAAGSFITLAIAPVLLFESNEKKLFQLRK